MLVWRKILAHGLKRLATPGLIVLILMVIAELSLQHIAAVQAASLSINCNASQNVCLLKLRATCKKMSIIRLICNLFSQVTQSTEKRCGMDYNYFHESASKHFT